MDPKGKSGKCLENHVDVFLEFLASKNNTAKHVRRTRTRLREVLRGCRFDLIDNLNAGRVSVWLKDQRAGGMSPATSNHYVTSAKSFGNWLFKDRRHPENPIGHLTKVNARVDVRVVRRALSQDELAALVEAAENGEAFRDPSGGDKAMLYLMAAFTGLRVSELASLTTDRLEFRSDPPTLTVEAACSKHRREDVLPLHPELALRLRHKFVTDLAASGVHPKLAKELARHSTITLTMDRYAHVGLLDMNAALKSLPGIPNRPAESGRAVATGTDPNLVATLVATVSGNLGNSQGLSKEQRGDTGKASPRSKLSSNSVLREELSTSEEWWGGT